MTTEKQDPRIGKKRRLTGADWPDGLRGRVMTVTNVDEDDDLIIEDEEGQRWTIWTGMYDYSATHVDDDPPSPPADTRKRLREYTDIGDGDVVVIAGVPFTIVTRDGDRFVEYGGPRTVRLGIHKHFEDMLVDEVRRAKRIRREVVLRENPNGSIKIGGLSYTKVDEREVEE